MIAVARRLKPSNLPVGFYSLASDPKTKADQDAWFAAHDADLDAVKTVLSEKPEWYVERDYDMSAYLLLPELAEMKFVGRMLALRAERRAKKRQSEPALADFRAVRDLSARLAKEPVLIGLLVGVALESTALRSVEDLVDLSRSDRASLQALESAVLDSYHLKDPEASLRGEFYFNLAICRNLKRFGGVRAFSGVNEESNTSPPAPKPADLQRTGLPHGMYERASLDVMAGQWNKIFLLIHATEPPHEGCTAPLDAFESESIKRFRASELLAHVLFPAFDQAEAALTQCRVSQSLALAFVRAFRYKAEKGRWPASLKEIGADFPDPFNSGKPIQAGFSDTEVRVWSVGRNKIDDDGQWRDTQHQKADDVVFVWPPTLRKTPKQ